MKKSLCLSLITIVLSFGIFGCSNNGKDFFVRNGEHTGTFREAYPFFPSFQPRYVNNPEIDSLKIAFRQQGFEEGEISWMAKIATEDYGPNVWPILYVGGHFIYGPFDGNTYSNCPLYALKRFLRHLGILGIVDKDLWYRWSDKQLRNIGVDELGFPEMERSQHVGLSPHQITMLVRHLEPNAIPHLKHGCARGIAVKEKQNIMGKLSIINDLIKILEAVQRQGADIAINMAIERKFVDVERLRNHTFSLDALRGEVDALQREVADYEQRGYFLGENCGIMAYNNRSIERLHDIFEYH
jgi:hypothetical protein